MTLTHEEMLEHCEYGTCDGSGKIDEQTFCKCWFDETDDDLPDSWADLA